LWRIIWGDYNALSISFFCEREYEMMMFCPVCDHAICKVSVDYSKIRSINLHFDGGEIDYLDNIVCKQCSTDLSVMDPVIKFIQKMGNPAIEPCCCGSQAILHTFSHPRVLCSEKNCICGPFGDPEYPQLLGGVQASAIFKWNNLMSVYASNNKSRRCF